MTRQTIALLAALCTQAPEESMTDRQLTLREAQWLIDTEPTTAEKQTYIASLLRRKQISQETADQIRI